MERNANQYACFLKKKLVCKELNWSSNCTTCLSSCEWFWLATLLVIIVISITKVTVFVGDTGQMSVFFFRTYAIENACTEENIWGNSFLINHIFVLSFCWINLLHRLLREEMLLFFMTFLAATKQLYKWYFQSVRPSVCPSVCHTFFTMFPSSYHHEIFRSYYHGQKWCPCKRSRSEVKGQGHRGQHPT